MLGKALDMYQRRREAALIWRGIDEGSAHRVAEQDRDDLETVLGVAGVVTAAVVACTGIRRVMQKGTGQ